MLYHISLFLVLYLLVCTSSSPTPILLLPCFLSLLVTTKLFSTSVSLLLCHYSHKFVLFLDSTYK